jgi:hypothetical protein
VNGEQVGGRRGGDGDLREDGQDEVVRELVQVVRPTGKPLPPPAGALGGDRRLPEPRRRSLPLLSHPYRRGRLAGAGIEGPAPRPHGGPSACRRKERERGRDENRNGWSPWLCGKGRARGALIDTRGPFLPSTVNTNACVGPGCQALV